MSCGEIASKSPGCPSMIINGFWLEFNEPVPRILRVDPSLPGTPEPCVTAKPGANPANAVEALLKGLEDN